MKLLIALPTLLAIFISGQLYAANTLVKMGKKQGRDYHAALHDDGCKACHDQGLKLPPTDKFCQDCHNIEDLANATKPNDDKHQWRNPHDNMHYGKAVPCIECHAEHKVKRPLCLDCHNFEF